MITEWMKGLHEGHDAHWIDGNVEHYGSVEEEYHALRESVAWIDFPDLSLLKISGEDRKIWLQGQVTNDVRDFEDGGFVSCCLLSPTGQVVSDLKIWAFADFYVVILPAICKERALKRMHQALIIEDVRIEDLSSEFGVVSVQGPKATDVLGEEIEIPRLNCGMVDFSSSRGYLLRSDRSGSGGWDLCFRAESLSDVRKVLKDVKPAGRGAWEICRVEAGIPVYGKEINENTLVMELGEKFISENVSFEKGCYTGQEVVMRIHARGHVNKSLVGIVCEKSVSSGAKVSHAEREDAGVVTSAVESPVYGAIALAILRKEAMRYGESVVILEGEDRVGGEVKRLPFG